MPSSSRLRRSLILLAAAALLAAPAQALAGAWTLGQGELNIKLAVTYWSASQKFASDQDSFTLPGASAVQPGDRVPFDPATGGDLQAVATLLQARLGLLRWLDLGVTVPLVWTDFDTAPVDSVDGRFGLGDLLLELQAGGAVGPAAFAATLLVKAPTGGFDPSVFSAPITEGQWDVQPGLSAGLSLHPYGYANIALGWRFRTRNGDNGRAPGDELHLRLEGGIDLPAGLMLKGAFDALVGFAGDADSFGVSTPLPRRRLHALAAGVLWRSPVGLTAEVEARFPVAGEDYPTGAQLSVGISYQLKVY